MKPLLASSVASFVASALLFLAGSAWGSSEYRAALLFDAGLPALRTGTALDGPHNLDGDWSPLSQRTVSIRARDQIGTTPGGDPVWGDWRTAHGLHNVGGPPTTLGEIFGHQPTLGHFTSAEGEVGWYGIRSAGLIDGGGAELSVASNWQRGFSLAAGESLSFTALCTLAVLGDAAPLAAVASFDVDAAASFATLSLADASNRVGASFSAALTSAFAGNLSDVFSSTAGADGRLVLSITNPTDAVMTGRLGAGTSIDVSAPIPEPLPVALLALGGALVGWGVRRSRPRQPHLQPHPQPTVRA